MGSGAPRRRVTLPSDLLRSHLQEAPMSFDPSPKVRDPRRRLTAFMEEHSYPNEKRHIEEAESYGPWKVLPLIDELKPKARAEGLWNLFLPESEHGAGLTNLEYAPLREIMGRSLLAREMFNCSAPGAGNTEVLARYGTVEHQERWLKPLLAGGMCSCFAMTEPDATSSDATNIESTIVRHRDSCVINGRKWHATNATDPRCKIAIFMGKTDPANPECHKQQSMIPAPMDTPGVKAVRPLPVFGFYRAPDRASEVLFENVRVPAANMLLGEGRGFEIAQGRLGPGRIHHCMRQIGPAERALERMGKRTLSRVAFGKPAAQQRVTIERIAESRILIEQARLPALNAAYPWDTVGNKIAKVETAMIKVGVPNVAGTVIDWAIQTHGGGGTSNDFGLAHAYAMSRVPRLADGPGAVHRSQIGKPELRKYQRPLN